MLQVDATIRLSLGNYEACISPAAGARLTRLLWHGPASPLECVTPWHHTGEFDPRQWPKAGAFPMLPFANRLRNARFNWASKEIKTTPQRDQPHGLHGIGHRRPWEVVQASGHALTLSLNHEQADADWPWSFAAEMRYVLTPAGLQVSISLQNTSSVTVPAALGWHPFIPLAAPATATADDAKVTASHLHDIGLDGLSRAFPHGGKGEIRSLKLSTLTSQTIAYEGWDGQLLIAADSKHSLRLGSSDASCLVLHVPAGREYICAEPVITLPGALENYSEAQKQSHLALAPGATRQMTCSLGVVTHPV
jgi:aldose 1-epimerase